jgi:hypothetical protein
MTRKMGAELYNYVGVMSRWVVNTYYFISLLILIYISSAVESTSEAL